MANPTAAAQSTPPPASPAKRLMAFPVLNNMGPRGIPIPPLTKTNDDGKEEIVDPGTTIVLPQGVSFVPASQWARAKKQKNLGIALKTKIRGTAADEWRTMPIGQPILVEMAAVDAEDPLGAMSEPEAIEFLGDVKSPAVLGELLALEKRPRIQREIKDRKTAIETKGIRAVEERADRAVLSAD
jgi:hypothetical protein